MINFHSNLEFFPFFSLLVSKIVHVALVGTLSNGFSIVSLKQVIPLKTVQSLVLSAKVCSSSV